MAEAQKKSRGESGARNAATKPFRLNGRPADWAAQSAGANNVGARHTGAHMARGAIGALLVSRLGYFRGFAPSHRLDSLMSQSLEDCPVAGAVFDGIGQ